MGGPRRADHFGRGVVMNRAEAGPEQHFAVQFVADIGAEVDIRQEDDVAVFRHQGDDFIDIG